MAEGQDFLALGGEAEVGVDDGEGAGFGELGEETGGDYVDAGEGQGVQRGRFCGLRKWGVASGEWRVERRRREISRFARNDGAGWRNDGAGWRKDGVGWRNGGGGRARYDGVFVIDAAAGELELVVEEELAGGFAGLDG